MKKIISLLVLVFVSLMLVSCDGFSMEEFLYGKNGKKEDAESTNLMIEFLETGNKYTGDAIYIKAGDIDILVDAGSRNSSSDTIAAAINEYCTDSKLEYVIATHAHQDHIAGFVGTKAAPGIFERYTIDTLIDFPLTNATSQVYQNYCTLRDNLVENGTKHYTADKLIKGEDGLNRIIKLSDDISLEFLDNYYYYNQTSNENNYSVCFMLRHNEKKFLFTGDLEDEGEEKLVELNELEEVDLYKAGHHGSYTAGSLALLNVIKPKTVVCCCCAGSDEYTKTKENQFPAQAFISRIAKFTTQVYVTTLATEDGFTSMNGTIKAICDGKTINFEFSNNSTVLKDTDWFKENRVWE